MGSARAIGESDRRERSARAFDGRVGTSQKTNLNTFLYPIDSQSYPKHARLFLGVDHSFEPFQQVLLRTERPHLCVKLTSLLNISLGSLANS